MKKKVKRSKAPKPWTKKQAALLFHGISISGLAWFQKHCKRSAAAIYAKVRRDYGPGGLTRGAHTLWGLARETGYSRGQLRRAQSALGQKWKRLGPRGSHLISEDQVEELTAWLAHDYWCARLRLYACAWCGTSTRPARGRGLCGRCYERHRYLCRLHGLPASGIGQMAVLKKTGRSTFAARTQSGSFPSNGVDRLAAGGALTEAQLDEWVRWKNGDGR